MLGGQHLFEQRLELHFAEDAARLDVGQHALQVADAHRQRLHFAEPLVDLVQPVGHLLEALAEARFERALQLLVDRPAHLVELGRVRLLQLRELRFHRRAHFRQPPSIRFAQPLQLGVERVGQRLLHQRELCREGVDLCVLRPCRFRALLHQRGLEAGEVLAEFLAGAACRVADFLAKGALGARALGAQGGEQFGRVVAVVLGRTPQHKDRDQHEVRRCEHSDQQEYPEADVV